MFIFMLSSQSKLNPKLSQLDRGMFVFVPAHRKRLKMIFLKEKKQRLFSSDQMASVLTISPPTCLNFITDPSSWQPINSPWRELISDRQACSSQCTLFGFPQNLSKSIKGRQQIAHPISLFGFPPDLSKSTWLSFRRLIKIVIFTNIK